MMTITLQSLIPEVRMILRDSNSVHYTDIQILNGIVDAFARLFSLRPESRYVDGKLHDVVFPQTESELKAFEVEVERRWRIGLIYFSAARCYEADITDTVNMQLAVSLKQQADVAFAQ